MKNYYQILQVASDADHEVIRAAYRTLSSRYHPDKNGGDESLMKEVNEAYACLGDDVSRQQYDEQLRVELGGAKYVPDDVSSKWSVALKLYPELQKYYEKLAGYSADIAAEYVKSIIEKKRFDFARHDFGAFRDKFLSQQFGVQFPLFMRFVDFLYAEKRYEDVRRLAQFSNALGSNIATPKVWKIIESIDGEYYKKEREMQENTSKEYRKQWWVMGVVLPLLFVALVWGVSLIGKYGLPSLSGWTVGWGLDAGNSADDSGEGLSHNIVAPVETLKSTDVQEKDVRKFDVVLFPVFDFDGFYACALKENISNIEKRNCQGNYIAEYEKDVNSVFDVWARENGFSLKNDVGSLRDSIKKFMSAWCEENVGLSYGPGSGAGSGVQLCIAKHWVHFASLLNNFVVGGVRGELIDCRQVEPKCRDAEYVSRNFYGAAMDRQRQIGLEIPSHVEVNLSDIEDEVLKAKMVKDFVAEWRHALKQAVESMKEVEDQICGMRTPQSGAFSRGECQVAVWGKFYEELEESKY